MGVPNEGKKGGMREEIGEGPKIFKHDVELGRQNTGEGNWIPSPSSLHGKGKKTVKVQT